jgi:hypothetical protein
MGQGSTNVSHHPRNQLLELDYLPTPFRFILQTSTLSFSHCFSNELILLCVQYQVVFLYKFPLQPSLSLGLLGLCHNLTSYDDDERMVVKQLSLFGNLNAFFSIYETQSDSMEPNLQTTINVNVGS